MSWMALSESLAAIAVRELDSTTCFCGQPKSRGQSFCKRDYWRLPVGLRVKLSRTFSEGYAEHYDEAKDWLRLAD